MADALDSKSSDRKVVEVQVLSPVLKKRGAFCTAFFNGGGSVACCSPSRLRCRFGILTDVLHPTGVDASDGGGEQSLLPLCDRLQPHRNSIDCRRSYVE